MSNEQIPTQEPEVTNLETILSRSAFQALEPVRRPPHWGVDLDPDSRPGVPMMKTEPQIMENARWPVERQVGEPASPRHGRSNKPMPPVFGTALPPRGVSGMLRRLAYRYPDHKPRHWLLKMFADRVDSWGHRTRKLLPLVAVAALATFAVRSGTRPRRRRTRWA
jgi:hypothetical protein